jgi:5'-3' exonuclease
MGIPFYFASLIKAHAGIVQTIKKNQPHEVDVFGIDFNCLIHRYLKDEEPILSVIEALDYILKNFCKAKQVIIALDGLVPYAKIVQQRYRRMRVKEPATFDRNQISPDTPYMRELEQAVQSRFPYAILSKTSQPGEGEHKLITEIKKIPEKLRKTICIYGLDADLIIICLKHSNLSLKMSLMRESTEFNDPKLKQAEFATLQVQTLLSQLPMPISQYAALSILCFGNDFMPNLAMFSLREGGYDRALQLYEECKSPDLLTKEGREMFLKYCALKEIGVLKERIGMRKRPEEKSVMGKDSSLLSKKYGLHILDGVSNMAPVVEAYWKTFEWTMYYFDKSEPLNWDWVYPYSDAPLIIDIVKYKVPEPENTSPLKFHVTNQLQFIMPKASLRTAKRKVVYLDEIHNETRNPWMKKHDWEMKPRISLPWHPTDQITSVCPVSS